MRSFRTVWLGQTVSLFGSSLSSFALGVWVFQETGSAIGFGLVILLRSIPYLLVAPVAGVWIDRLNRRTVMAVSDSLAALNILAVLGLLAADRLEVWHIYVVVSVASLLFAFQQNAYSAAVAQLVEPTDRGRANGMVQISQAFAGVVVPMVAGLLYLAYGLKGIIIFDLTSFGVAVFTLLRVPMADPIDRLGERRSWGEELREGWSAFEARPELFSLMWLFAIVNLAAGFLQVLFTPMVLNTHDAVTLGVVMSCGGLGMLAGGISMGVSGGPKHRARAIARLLLVAGVSIAIAGLGPFPWLWAAAGFVFFFAHAWIEASAQTLYQNHTPEEVHGKVFALHRMLGQSTVPIGYLLSPVLAETYFEPWMAETGGLAASVGGLIGVGPGRGMGLMFVVVGVVMALVALGASRNRRLRDLDEVSVEDDPLAERTIRPLGVGEAFFAAHGPPPNTSPAMTSCVLARLEGDPPSVESVRRAVAHVLGKYEILSLGIEPLVGTPGYRFVRSPLGPKECLDRVFESRTGEVGDLEDLFRQEVNQGVGHFREVLARVVYLQLGEQAALLGNVHHTATDAVSGFSLLHEVLHLCRKIDAGELVLDGDWEEPGEVETVPLFPPIEDCFGETFGFRDAFPLALSMTWEMFRRGAPMVLPPDTPPIPVAGRETQIEVRDLDGATLRSLRGEARRHRVTVHGVVTSVAAQALAVFLRNRRKVGGPKADAPIPLAVSHAVDLRPFTRGSRRLTRSHLGFAAGSVQCRLDVDLKGDASVENGSRSEALWQRARQSCLDVRREIKERRSHLLGFALVRRPIDAFRMAEGPRLGRTASLGISDLGRYPHALDHGSFRIAEILVGGATHIAGGLLNLMLVSVGGSLRLVFLGADPILSHKELSWLADATSQALGALAKGDDDVLKSFPKPPPSPTESKNPGSEQGDFQ